MIWFYVRHKNHTMNDKWSKRFCYFFFCLIIYTIFTIIINSGDDFIQIRFRIYMNNQFGRFILTFRYWVLRRTHTTYMARKNYEQWTLRKNRQHKKARIPQKKAIIKEEMKKWTTIDSKNRMKLIIMKTKIFKKKLKKEWTSLGQEKSNKTDIRKQSFRSREKKFSRKT